MASNKVKSRTLRLWPFPTQRSSTDSSSMPHLSAELLILPLLTPHSPAPHSSLLTFPLLTPPSPAPHFSFSRSSLLAPPDVSVTFLAQDRHFCLTFVQSRRSSVLSTAPFVMRSRHLSLPVQFQAHTHDFCSSNDSLNHWLPLDDKSTTTDNR